MVTDAEIMAQVQAAFREEQAEHRQAAGELLLELERAPDHPQRQELLDRLFREAHSLKGGARAANQPEVELIAHRVEDIFSAARQGRELTPEICDPIYAALDAIGVLIAQAGDGCRPDMAPYQALLAQLEQIQSAPAPAAVPPAARAPERPPATHVHATSPPPEGSQPAPDPRQASGETSGENGAATVRLPIATLDGLLNEAGELLTCTVFAQQHARAARELASTTTGWRRVWRQVAPAVTRLQVHAPALRPTVHYLDGHPGALQAELPRHSSLDTAALVEALLHANALIGKLENQLAGHAHQAAESHTRLQAVAERMRQQVRRTRMLPLATLFSPLRLQMREIARSAGKQVALDLDDGGAEADRQVLERLSEVLLHALRNAVDHGIESPEERTAQGKPAEGCIALRAEASGDTLTLTISDDGAGLDLAAIRRRALASGQWGPAELERLSEAELADLIFLPGFSTRTAVSELSGRGVGLDIVRSRIERMRGRVTVRSQVRAGCSLTIRVPLSLTSSHGLMLRAGAASYVVPLDMVQRIVPVAAREIRTLEGRPVLLIDGRPLPAAHLADLLGCPAAPAHAGATWYGLLLGAGERQIVCLVDGVLDEQELVIHRLPAPIQQVQCVAGATILADGSIVPILDAVDLLEAAAGARRAITLVHEASAPDRQRRVLVVDDSITTRTLEKNVLAAAGYAVCLATDGVEAMQLLEQLVEQGGCDLILSDVDMPRMSGFELTARVRGDARFQHLPVVLVTSLDTTEDRERGIAAGADAYIVKRQFEQQALLETVRRLI